MKSACRCIKIVVCAKVVPDITEVKDRSFRSRSVLCK
jgi:hypothetical protein